MMSDRPYRVVAVRDDAGREVGRARVYAGRDRVEVHARLTDARMRDRVFIAHRDELRFDLGRRAVAEPPAPAPLHPTHLRVFDPMHPDPEGPHAC